MSTFFVLPPREVIEHRLQEFLGRILPGLPLTADLPSRLLSQLTSPSTDEIYIHREELPDVLDSAGVVRVLQEAFGAEPGDRVVEIGPIRSNEQSSANETVIGGSVSISPTT